MIGGQVNREGMGSGERECVFRGSGGGEGVMRFN